MFVCLSRFVNTVSLHPDGNCIGGGTTDSVVKVYTCVMVMSITQQVWDVRMNTYVDHILRTVW